MKLICLVFLAILLTQPSCIKGQDQLDPLSVAQRIGRDYSASFQIVDFQKFVTSLLRTQALGDDLLIGIEDLKSYDPNFAAGFEKLVGYAGSLHSVHVFIRTSKQSLSEILLVLESDLSEDDAKSFVGMINDFAKPHFSEIELHLDYDAGFCVIASSLDTVDEVAKHFANETEPENSLGSDRRYLGAYRKAEVSKNAVAFGFLRPSQFDWFFGVDDEIDSKRLEVDELPFCSAVLEFRDNPASLVVNGEIKNTLPSTGIAKVWDSYRAIPEMPEFAFEVIGVDTFAWSPEEIVAAKRMNFERANSEDSYEKRMVAYESRTGLKRNSLLLTRCSNRIAVTYNDTMGMRRFMSLDRVADDVGMNDFVWNMFKKEDKKGFSVLDGHEVAGSTVFGFTKESLKRERDRELKTIESDIELKRMYLDEYFEKTGERTDDLEKVLGEVTNEGFLLNREWFLYGHVPDLIRQVKLMNGEAIGGAAANPQLRKVKTFLHDVGNQEPSYFSFSYDHRVRAVTDPFRKYLQKKYAGIDKSVVRSISNGRAYEAIKNEKPFSNVDTIDIFAFLVCKEINENVGDFVIAQSRESPDLLRYRIGLFVLDGK